MIITLLGEDLLLDDESRDKEYFDVTLDDSRACIHLARIESIHDSLGMEIGLDEIDIPWATAMAQVELAAMLEEKQIYRDASRLGISI